MLTSAIIEKGRPNRCSADILISELANCVSRSLFQHLSIAEPAVRRLPFGPPSFLGHNYRRPSPFGSLTFESETITGFLPKAGAAENPFGLPAEAANIR